MSRETTETISKATRALIKSLPADVARLMNRPDIRRASAVLLYLDRVEELRTENPSVALSLAETGRSLASKLRFCKPARRREVLAKSFMVSGGIARTLADHDFADAAYICAYRLLRPQNDPENPLMVELMGRWAFLRRDQRQFKAARTFAEHGLALARRNGDRRLIGRSLVHLANSVIYDKPEQAVPLLREALKSLDRRKDQSYAFAAFQALGVALCESDGGDPKEILTIAEAALSLATGRANFLQCLWLSGRAYERLGQLEEAAERVETAREGLDALGLVTYAAAASLDSAAIHLRLDNKSRTRVIARQAYDLFKVMNLEREALSAFTLFKRALLRNELTLDVITTLRKHIQPGGRR